MTAAVSVVIPSLLRTRPGTDVLWLEGALWSVWRQTLKPAEVIVGLDPGMELPPLALSLTLMPLRTPPTFLRAVNADAPSHQEACNAGVRAARSPLVAFLEDDDTWEPDHLERLVAAWQEYRVDVVTASQMEVTAAGDVLAPFDFPTCSSWLVNRVQWLKLGGFDTRFKIHHDNEMLCRLKAQGVRRVHLAEVGAAERPWLVQVAACVPVQRVLPHLTVRRTKHADSIMGGMHDPQRFGQSRKEYAALEVLYGGLGW